MSKYSVINLKTDPELKKKAAVVANKLGISISAVLNNELRRFASEQSVIFDVPETPNAQTAKLLSESKKEIESGNFYEFENNDEAISFLSNEFK